jgi:hypothetical protein
MQWTHQFPTTTTIVCIFPLITQQQTTETIFKELRIYQEFSNKFIFIDKRQERPVS